MPVTLPTELEDYIPQVEEFYRAMHSGRKLQWHHHMSNGVVSVFIWSCLCAVHGFIDGHGGNTRLPPLRSAVQIADPMWESW